MDCKHPPSKLYTGNYYHPIAPGKSKLMMWVGCTACGKILTPEPKIEPVKEA